MTAEQLDPLEREIRDRVKAAAFAEMKRCLAIVESVRNHEASSSSGEFRSVWVCEEIAKSIAQSGE